MLEHTDLLRERIGRLVYDVGMEQPDLGDDEKSVPHRSRQAVFLHSVSYLDRSGVSCRNLTLQG